MLANPVAFNFDEKGRIFVAETYRYQGRRAEVRVRPPLPHCA